MTPTAVNLGAAWLEAGGNALLIVALVTVGRQPWPLIALKMLAAVAAVYCATNVFYSLAYVGRELELWQWWDTPTEAVVRVVQIGSMWAMLAAGVEALVAARD